MAAFAKDPAWELSKEEAKAVAETTSNVAAHYGKAVDSKFVDWMLLIGTLGAIYGVRLAPMLRSRFGKNKASQSNVPRETNAQQTESQPFSMPPLPTVAGAPHFTQH